MEYLSDLVDEYITKERPLSLVIDAGTVLAQAIAATQAYAGYARLESEGVATETMPLPHTIITDFTQLSLSEWAVIKPLFLLFVERENAIQLEASRGLGADVFGRLSSEIQQDINNYLLVSLPKNAFCQQVITV